jgi:hypothetical protein
VARQQSAGIMLYVEAKEERARRRISRCERRCILVRRPAWLFWVRGMRFKLNLLLFVYSGVATLVGLVLYCAWLTQGPPAEVGLGLMWVAGVHTTALVLTFGDFWVAAARPIFQSTQGRVVAVRLALSLSGLQTVVHLALAVSASASSSWRSGTLVISMFLLSAVAMVAHLGLGISNVLPPWAAWFYDPFTKLFTFQNERRRHRR